MKQPEEITMTKNVEEFNINNVKRHIKNLIAGNNITRGDLLTMYKDIVKEQVSKRVENLFDSMNINQTIENFTRQTVRSYLNDIANKGKTRWDKDNIDVERIILDECEKQVKAMIRENFTIQVKKPYGKIVEAFEEQK